ncbi:MAG: dUTP diphosphatase [Oscillospiraceae bacterium]|jgi:dUTP pyrophosphatase|nr:dUTP diphosphatase [Oscillospiraceae bacterium]
MNGMTVKIKILDSRARPPVYASEGAAGADLRACISGPVEIRPGETVKVGLGFSAALPEGYAGLVFARSGMAAERGIAPANKVGVVDSDYRGEWMVPLHNHGTAAVTVSPGERVAQLLVVPAARAEFVVSDALDATERGGGGFGSTGSHDTR